MDLEPHRPASLPIVTGPVLVVLGVAIHIGLSEWVLHRPWLFRHQWLSVVLNDLGTTGIVLGCVILGVQLLRRP